MLGLIGAKIKLYFFGAIALAVSIFVYIFKRRGRKIKKQEKEIAGLNSKNRIAESEAERAVSDSENERNIKEMSASELLKKNKSNNSN